MDLRSRSLRLWAAAIATLATGAAVLAAVIGPASAQESPAPITAPPLPSVYTASTNYSLTVNGTEVPVVNYSGYDYAQFSMGSGAATVAVTKLNKTNVGVASISPQKLGIVASLSGSTATFTMPEPDYLIVKLDGRRQLVLTADPEETAKPASSGDGIFNVTAAPFNADASGGTVTTQAIQAAIDAAGQFGTASGSQGTVYIPNGVYLAGNLVLPSNTAVYLEPGAVLRVTPDKSLYSVDAFKSSQNRDLTWFVHTEIGSSNIKLYGRGTIDGNGMAATKAGFGTDVIVPVGTSNFTLDGLTIREGASWTVIPVRSHDLAFRNMKIYNRFDMGENDAFDVNESQNVTVERSVGVALDDPFSTKSWGKAKPGARDITFKWPGDPQEVRNVTFDGILSWTFCYGLKVGQGVFENQQDVTFKNSVVYDAAVGIGIHHKYGHGAVTGVTFENIDIERLDFSNDNNRTWAALFVVDGTKDGSGPISDVTIRNVTVRDRGQTPALVSGLSATAGVGSVTFDEIRMPGKPGFATSLADLGVTGPAFATAVTVLPAAPPSPSPSPSPLPTDEPSAVTDGRSR
ncbi:MAG: coagulation factor 5/8 type protein [Actinomycetia bacterium]|nr:coagulation factor 5/8 type protein [Actinomycetes bacterium]